jgi:hypothetical protein
MRFGILGNLDIANRKNAQKSAPKGCFMQYFWVSKVLGVVLLVTAGLKAHTLLADAPTYYNLFGAVEVTYAACLIEFVIGNWLLVGLHPQTARRVSIALFSIFLAAALGGALNGDYSCGCLGAVQISPWYAVVFDALAVAALLIFGRPIVSLTSTTSRTRWLTSGVISILFGAAIWIDPRIGTSPYALDSGGSQTESSNSLDSSRWPGHLLPLLHQIDIGQTLGQGKWLILFYKAGCSECRLAIPRCLGLAYASAGRSRIPRIALVELPPYDDGPRAPQGNRLYTRCHSRLFRRLSRTA